MTYHWARTLSALFLIPAALGAQRRVDHVVHSDSLPALSIRVSETFTYLGRIAFPVDSIAEAEEFIFGVIDGNELTRAVIVHFEHFLPGQPHSFRYPRLRMTQLGAAEYLHQTWAFADLSLFHEPTLVKLLAQHRLRAGARWVMDRYVRALPEDPQYEVIIFYLEAEAVTDPAVVYGGMPVAPPPPPSPPPAVEAAIIQRARAAFEVLP